MLGPILNCYKNGKLYEKAVGNYLHALRFITNCCKIQIMYNRDVGTYPSTISLSFCLFVNAINLKI